MGVRYIDKWTTHVSFGTPAWVQSFSKGLSVLLEDCLNKGMPDDVATAIIEHAMSILSDHALTAEIRYIPADE